MSVAGWKIPGRMGVGGAALGWGGLTLCAVLSVVLQWRLYVKLGERALCYADWAGFSEAVARPVPGGVLQWGADFLAVLFHVPWLGGAVFLALGAGVTLLAHRWVRLPMAVAWLPWLQVLLQVTYCGFSVWIFENAAFPQAYLLEWAAALLVLGALKRFGAWGFLGVVLYPFLGLGVLIGLLGGALTGGRNGWFRLGCVAVAVAAFGLSKWGCYADPSWMNLLKTQWCLLYDEGALAWNLLSVLVMGIVFGAEALETWAKRLINVARMRPWMPAVLMLGFAVTGICFCDPPGVLYAILRCEANLRRGDGQAATVLPEEQIVNHRMLSAYYIHGLWRAGQLEHRLFDVAWKVSHKTSTIDTMSLDGHWLLYHYGIVQLARRWCYESVIKLGWNAEHYALLAKIALVCNEMPLAERYARQLKRIPLRGKEAETFLAYARGERVPEGDELRRVAELHLRLCADNGSPTFENSKKLEECIYNRYAVLKNGSREMVTLYLCASLLLQETSVFLENYDVILNVWPERPLPRVFQQALLAAASQVPPDQQPPLTASLFTPGMLEAFAAFQKVAPTVHPAEEAFRNRFGKSFWYYASFLQ